MTRIMKMTVVVIVSLFAVQLCVAQSAKLTQDERMAWWRDARFGMFIHWGLYAVQGGEWRGEDYGKEMGGQSAEWLQYQVKLLPQEYRAALAPRFNPVMFNAREWVSLAKTAGMKYVVITAKHHEGFSLFDTEYTDYDVMDATPFKRDIIKEMADACHELGLKFGVYYSHSKDWYHRGFDEKTVAPTNEYQGMVKGHLNELLTNYGDISVLWFDMGDKFTEVNTEYGRIVKRLSPRTIISGRLRGAENISDYVSQGDRSIPEKGLSVDAETPMTFRDNWGYDLDDDNWKSEREMLERFTLCVARGANMLLNVGPKPDGTLCDEEIAGFKALGRWMDVNSESIYGTQASPFDYDFEWGSMTSKSHKLYLLVLKWSPEGIALHGLKTPVKKAYLLANKAQKALKVNQDVKAGTLTVKVPKRGPDPIVSVIVLELDDDIKVDPKAKGKYHWVKGKGIKLHPDARKR
jgi:alpha-L-fucosidase